VLSWRDLSVMMIELNFGSTGMICQTSLIVGSLTVQDSALWMQLWEGHNWGQPASSAFVLDQLARAKRHPGKGRYPLKRYRFSELLTFTIALPDPA
jgi:hypothetical protein